MDGLVNGDDAGRPCEQRERAKDEEKKRKKKNFRSETWLGWFGDGRLACADEAGEEV